MRRIPDKAWYLAPTGLNGVVSIASVPLLIFFLGAVGWADIALGQAIGLFGSVFVGLGWPVFGPALIARSSAREQYTEFMSSLWGRLCVGAAVTVVTVWVLFFVAPGNTVLLWTAISSNFLGCASSWYFLGINDPRGLFWRDAFARAMGTSLGLMGVALSGNGIWFAVGVMSGIAVSIYLSFRKVCSLCPEGREGPSYKYVLRSIRSQGNGFMANALFVGLSSMALPLAASVGGQVFIAFAVLDKVQKQLTTVALPLTQLIVGKMAADLNSGAKAIVTAKRMFRGIILSGFVLFVLMIPIGPLAVNVMSVGSVRVDAWATVCLAGVVGLAFVAQCLPVAVLVPISKLGYGVLGMFLAIMVGIPGVLYSAANVGVNGVLAVLCIIYLVPIVFGFIGMRGVKLNELAS